MDQLEFDFLGGKKEKKTEKPTPKPEAASSPSTAAIQKSVHNLLDSDEDDHDYPDRKSAAAGGW